MKKTFNFNGTTYTVTRCPAIAFCGTEDEIRTYALLVENTEDSGEIVRNVVFDEELCYIHTVDDFADMLSEIAREPDFSVLGTDESAVFDIYTDTDEYICSVTASIYE